MTQQTNGMPELKYSGETFRAMYEALKELQQVYAGYSFGTDKRSIPAHWNKVLEVLAKVEGK